MPVTGGTGPVRDSTTATRRSDRTCPRRRGSWNGWPAFEPKALPHPCRTCTSKPDAPAVDAPHAAVDSFLAVGASGHTQPDHPQTQQLHTSRPVEYR
jgi:hypothetical protein